ncbi:rhodanese-like domain-containing protein [Botryobacter ruber]|uniref:rhodanese-like domain-containing protein n=1 Tax=Botryobacter ruber TaxID=2171629 RepID=UPI000E0CA2ED|nr:rhodanese-like domain-containing protein [Botryobacter ruber]
MKILIATLAVILLTCNEPVQDNSINKRITATEYKEEHDNTKDAVLVDVRTPAEFKEGHLREALNSDYLNGQFQEDMQHWDKSKTYYLYCASGNRSGKAAKLMEEAGFKTIYNIGGYEDLKAAGLPVTAKNQKQNQEQ